MKRFVLFALVAVLALSVLAGCAPKPVPAPPAPVKVYVDGTYTAVGDANARGYVAAEVTIADDKIIEVKLVEYAGMAIAKPADYAWPEFHQAMEQLPGKFVAANNWDVEIISKATSTSNGSKLAVKRAMEKAMVTPPSAAKYFDGTFMAKSEADARGGFTVVLVTLEADKIKEVVIKSTTVAKETNAEGVEVSKSVFKDENYAWPEYHQALVELPKRFVAANSAEVDVYTKATGTSNQAKAAVTLALESAKRK